MRNHQALALLCSTLLFGQADLMAQRQSITWDWANVVCADMLNCSSGCSACNQPGQFASDFYGVGAAWIGVNTCPYPTVTGDNAVHTDGWGIGPEPLKAVMLVGVANGPMALDSIIIRHRAEGTGPMRLQISLKRNLMEPAAVVYDGPIDAEFKELVLTDMGSLQIPDGATAAGFQLQFRVYGSTAGAWLLDAIRVSATPVQGDIPMGIDVVDAKTPDVSKPMYDLLGRPADPGPGVRIAPDGRRYLVIE